MFRLVQTCSDLSEHILTCTNMFRLKNFWICHSKFENLIHLIHLKLCNLSTWRKFLQFVKLKKISSSWRKFCQLEENLFKNCPNMFRLVQMCSDLSKQVQTCPNRVRLLQTSWKIYLSFSKCVQTCPNMSKLVQTCSNLSKYV